MKKLYLSSYNIPTPDDFFSLVGKPPLKIKLGVVVNAKDYYDEETRAQKITKLVSYLNDLDLRDLVVIDLREYPIRTHLKMQLSNLDAIWVAGGNTFYLRYAMRESGFDMIIPSLLESGLVYAGDSAGAVVVGPTLKGINKVDDPSGVAEVIMTGVNLVSYTVVPHMDSEYIGGEMSQISALYRKGSKIELNDNQAVIFIDDVPRITTSEQNLI